MSAIDNGKRLAFPLCVEGCPPDLGLSKREWFAGLAMQGMCAADGCDGWTQDEIAVSAVQIADALLAELAKERTP